MFHGYQNHGHHQHLLHEGLANWRQSALGRLCLSSFIYSLGLQMLSLFILFYLYEAGWPLVVVTAYLLGLAVCNPLATRLGAHLVNRWDVARAMLASNILRLVFTILLFSLGPPSIANYGLLAIIIILDALSIRVYGSVWGFHFSSLKQQKKSGRQLALAWGMTSLSGIAAPLVGGLTA